VLTSAKNFPEAASAIALALALALVLAAGPVRGDGLGRVLQPGVRKSDEVAALVRQALGTDPDASRQALDRLVAMGEPAKPRLAAAVRRLLQRGREVVLRADRLLGDPARAANLQQQVNATRAEARANIKILKHDKTLEIARDFYEKLDGMVPLLGKVLEVRAVVCRAMAGRAHLLELWRGLGMKDARFVEANEAALRAKAEAVLDLTLEEAQRIPKFGHGNPPAEGSTAWHIWFYAACRAIEAYNASLRNLMSEDEAANAQAVNHYRELLGILPMEVDARLIQAARRHSKEMADLDYFGHTSPNPEHETPSMRMKQAGCEAGSGENCANGYPTGKAAFWGWFSSPPHHQNMVKGGHTAFGVGKWGSLWTQNFGRGKRVMLLDADVHARLTVPMGDVGCLSLFGRKALRLGSRDGDATVRTRGKALRLAGCVARDITRLARTTGPSPSHAMAQPGDRKGDRPCAALGKRPQLGAARLGPLETPETSRLSPHKPPTRIYTDFLTVPLGLRG